MIQIIVPPCIYRPIAFLVRRIGSSVLALAPHLPFWIPFYCSRCVSIVSASVFSANSDGTADHPSLPTHSISLCHCSRAFSLSPIVSLRWYLPLLYFWPSNWLGSPVKASLLCPGLYPQWKRCTKKVKTLASFYLIVALQNSFNLKIVQGPFLALSQHLFEGKWKEVKRDREIW